MTAAELPGDVVDRLAVAIRAELGAPIRPEENFFEAGLTSHQLVGLHAEITRGMARPFSVTVLFARPNLTALRRHLENGGRMGPTGGRPAGGAAAEERRRTVVARRRLRADGLGAHGDGQP